MIRITPAAISSHFDGRFFNLPPSQNPRFEFKKVINAIRHAGLRILLPYNDNEIPAENASMLVAIPINSRHDKLIQTVLIFSFSKLSFINRIPSQTKITKIISFV